jgi:hypothetical protein
MGILRRLFRLGTHRLWDTLIARLHGTGGLGVDEWAGGRVEVAYPELLLLPLLSGPLGATAMK